MSLFISFVDPTTNEAYMAQSFEDTFGATVEVHMSTIKKNQYGINYKMATVRILEPTRELTRFMDQIHQHGSNTFFHRGLNSWTVTMAETAVSKTKPKII